MGKNQIIIIFGIFSLFLAVSCTSMPVETTCTLYGVVMSSSTDAPIKGALVVVQPGSQQIIAGNDGTFEITAVHAPNSYNQYRVLAQKKGYCANAVHVESVQPGERRYVPIILEPIE